ncbi:protein-disulfide isomerase [Microbacterium sp. NC79]|uniref:protein-disulfide isomerase n=1 Tax=Microbacterium sp. NC79 TaxID=2851009 RepID=UPI001C2C3ED2|nr:protein-disulfide isomerase [Microbacterium sp. NC79]MBV0895459.1 protein-disulfide isomerase [Microbacterium sp. NC79]
MSNEEAEGTPAEEQNLPEAKPETGIVPTTTGTTPVAQESRRDAVREKAQLVSAQQKRSRLIWRSVIGFVAVAVIAAAAIVVTNVVAGEAGKPLSEPKNLVNGGFVVDVDLVSASTSAGNGTITEPTATPEATEEVPVEETPDATPTAAPLNVNIYTDYHDADASAFQIANAVQLAKWVREGAITLTYYPIATVTGQSNGTKYSVRAMASVGCVATYSPVSLFAYHHELLATQPAVETEGYSNAELADLAIAIGADQPKKVRACIEDETFTVWAKKQTDEVAGKKVADSKVKLDGSFLVLIDGVKYVGNPGNAAEFAQAVLKASSDAFYAPTPTPTPSEVATETPAPEATTPAPTESVTPAPGT